MTTTLNIEQLKILVSRAACFSELSRLVGGISKKRIKRILKENNIDTSHFMSGGGGNRRPLSVYLSNEFTISSDHLKKRLFREGLKTPKCERCNRTEWEGNPIPIELHHVDGDKYNNHLENLRILCRNCHGLEPNHKGAAIKRTPRRKISRNEYVKTIISSHNIREVCLKLGLTPKGRNYDTIQGIMAKDKLVFLPELIDAKDYSDILCDLHSPYISPNIKKIDKPKTPRPKASEDYLARRRQREHKIGTHKEAGFFLRKVKNRPSSEEMQKLLWEMPVEQIGKLYGVNGNTIRKWFKGYEIKMSIPPSGYWVRRHLGYSHEESLVSQKRIRNPLHRPNEEQAKTALALLNEGKSLRQASKAIGFCHETTKAALIRFGIFPSDYKSPRGRPCKQPIQ